MTKLRTMPPGLLALAAILALTALLACSESTEDHTRYQCPMHPEVISDKPGNCPICGMRLVPIEKAGGESSTAPSAPAEQKAERPASSPSRKVMYRSTMNPNEVSDKPGKDSMGMDMVPFEVEAPVAGAVPGLAPVTITPEQERHINITFGTVEKRRLSVEVRTSARIVPDETRLFRVTTKVGGWVDRLYVNVTGQAVRKGEPLLTIYSPELLASQQELLSALAAARQLGESPYASVSQGSLDLLDAAKRRLRLWDISDEQIEKIEKGGHVEKTLTLSSPASGYVTEKSVLAGQKIMPGDSLLVVTDLSTVWAEADIYESDLPYVKVGMPAKLLFSYWPGREFLGRISFLNPFLDPMSRTLKARLEIPNLEFFLKPEMYGDVYLDYDLGEKVAVPEPAVMRTGERSYAFVSSGDGTLTPVEIQIGVRSDGYFEVLSGLKPGDRVVTSANFLVDSESSVKAALQAVGGK